MIQSKIFDRSSPNNSSLVTTFYGETKRATNYDFTNDFRIRGDKTSGLVKRYIPVSGCYTKNQYSSDRRPDSVEVYGEKAANCKKGLGHRILSGSTAPSLSSFGLNGSFLPKKNSRIRIPQGASTNLDSFL
jgi:hypothetical protein